MRAALATGAANGRKLFLKIHVKIQIVISCAFACNKNKAARTSSGILGYNIGSLAASGSTFVVDIRPIYVRLIL